MAFLDDKEIGKRLSNKRLEAKVSARRFAIEAGIDSSQYSKIEKGELPITEKILSKLISAYGLDKDWVLYGKNVPHETVMNEPEEPYHVRRRSQKNEPKTYTVPLVPVKAQAGYVSSYDQTDYLNTLEHYALPPGINPAGAVWRYFEVEGDSMEPTFSSGDVVLASQVPVEDWSEIRNFYAYVIVTEKQVLIKRIYRKSAKTWVLISDNEKEYKQEPQQVEQVKELWVFRRHINAKAPPPKKFEIKI